MTELARESVVEVVSERTSGTGWIYRVNRSGKAWILTNERLTGGARTLAVRLSGSGVTRTGAIVGLDKIRDLAVLTICCSNSWKALPISDMDNVRVGSDVVALGFRNVSVGLDLSVNAGVVSSFEYHATNRSWRIQSDADLNLVNSGGPLLNEQGQVIGVVSARVDPVTSENVSFAISMRTVNEELDFLEVRAVAVDPDFAVPSGPAREGEVTVTITQGVFDPQVVKVKVGTTVIWENVSGAASSATSLEGEAEQWDTKDIWKSAFNREVCCGQHTFKILGCHRYRSLFSNDTGVGAVCVVE